MKLLIAIPALNEEESIESIIERSLAAREHIINNSPVTEVEITVVSDGSTDQTVEKASRYSDSIKLIVFPQNKGYGAAIKTAWEASDAEIVAFLDADGTCDPMFFAPLCQTLVSTSADVVLGSRMNAQSQMPVLRRVGNFIFGTVLSLFAASKVKDTASGMRVVRRACLDKLFPLPDGMHFTPAMSARAMLSDSLRIREIDMPYNERAGESKLRVIKDGLRFSRVILEAALLYRPSRPLTLLSAGLMIAASLLMLRPALYYLQTRTVAEWMIYRFLVTQLLATTACMAFCASYLTDRIVSMALATEISGRQRKLFFRTPFFWVLPASLVAIGLALVLSSLLQLFHTGATYEHWSRYVVMAFCFSSAMILVITKAVDYVLNLIENRLGYLRTVSTQPVRRPGVDVKTLPLVSGPVAG